MRVAAAVLLSALALAGCTDASRSPLLARPSASAEGAARPTTAAFAWASHEARGDSGLRVQLDMPGTGACRIAGGFGYRPGGEGLRQVFLIRGPNVEGWALYERTESRHVHILGAADTREQVAESGAAREARLTTFRVQPGPGLLEVVLLGRGLEPWPNQLLEGAALGLNVTCDAPFRLVDVATSPAFFLFTQRTLAGGVGVHDNSVGSVVLLDEAQVSYDAAETAFHAGSVGGHGLLTLEGPAGERVWRIADAQPYSFTGQPGAYTVRLNRVGAGFDFFWGTLAAFAPADSDAPMTPGSPK